VIVILVAIAFVLLFVFLPVRMRGFMGRRVKKSEVFRVTLHHPWIPAQNNAGMTDPLILSFLRKQESRCGVGWQEHGNPDKI